MYSQSGESINISVNLTVAKRTGISAWKSPSPKSFFVDKYQNDTHAHAHHKYDTYIAEFHKKGKCTHRQLQKNDSAK
jgi:hypothetical protein